MDATIARLNIAHFKDLLKKEMDPQRRQTIAQLLGEEEAKLAQAIAREQTAARQGELKPGAPGRPPPPDRDPHG